MGCYNRHRCRYRHHHRCRYRYHRRHHPLSFSLLLFSSFSSSFSLFIFFSLFSFFSFPSFPSFLSLLFLQLQHRCHHRLAIVLASTLCHAAPGPLWSPITAAHSQAYAAYHVSPCSTTGRRVVDLPSHHATCYYLRLHPRSWILHASPLACLLARSPSPVCSSPRQLCWSCAHVGSIAPCASPHDLQPLLHAALCFLLVPALPTLFHFRPLLRTVSSHNYAPSASRPCALYASCLRLSLHRTSGLPPSCLVSSLAPQPPRALLTDLFFFFPFSFLFFFSLFFLFFHLPSLSPLFLSFLSFFSSSLLTHAS